LEPINVSMKKIKNVLLISLNERWQKYRATLKTCKSEFSEEAVHDLRVATRRLLAVMDILHALDPHPRIPKTRHILKYQLDALDDLRDVQVMLVDISELVVNSPELKAFELDLSTREKKLMRRARKDINGLQTSKLKRRIKKIRTLLEGNAFGRRFNASLLSAVDQAYSKAIQALGQIDASQSASIHRLRIAFKKFRYMVEIINPILKQYPEIYFKQMHDYQSKMGAVQDAEVFLSALTDFAERAALAPMLEPAQRYFEIHHAELISAFMNDKEAIHFFWRNLPDQNFPWEREHESLHHSPRDSS